MACGSIIRMACAIRWSICSGCAKRAPDAWIVGEKILEPGEFLRESWPIEGTTGYDFLNVAAGVLVSPQGMAELSEVYQAFLGVTLRTADRLSTRSRMTRRST